MRYCPSCKKRVGKEENFCEYCGAMLDNTEEKTPFYKTAFENIIYNLTNTANTTAEYSSIDINKNRIMAVLSYIGLLFIIPLIKANESPFVRYHLNQGIVLFIASVIGCITVAIPHVGWIVATVINVINFAMLMVGVRNAIKGEAKELPLIGRIRILK